MAASVLYTMTNTWPDPNSTKDAARMPKSAGSSRIDRATHGGPADPDLPAALLSSAASVPATNRTTAANWNTSGTARNQLEGNSKKL